MRKVPKHLQRVRKSEPGPGHYQAQSSIKKNNRHKDSTQDSTWMKVRQGFTDIPKNNPGPGTYSIENETIHYLDNRPPAMAPGYAFTNEKKDAKYEA